MRIDLKIDAVAKRIHAEIKASGTTLTRVYGIGPIASPIDWYAGGPVPVTAIALSESAEAVRRMLGPRRTISRG